MTKGWRYESGRHACAARGIKTGSKMTIHGGRWRSLSGKNVVVNFWNGLVENVKGLPSGWKYQVFDLDSADDAELELRKYNRASTRDKVMKILVKGGVLWDAKNIPKGKGYYEHHANE
jgi:hypothetical protein